MRFLSTRLCTLLVSAFGLLQLTNPTRSRLVSFFPLNVENIVGETRIMQMRAISACIECRLWLGYACYNICIPLGYRRPQHTYCRSDPAPFLSSADLAGSSGILKKYWKIQSQLPYVIRQGYCTLITKESQLPYVIKQGYCTLIEKEKENDTFRNVDVKPSICRWTKLL